MSLVWNIWVMLLLLKASRWIKQKTSRFSIGHLQETSRLFNLSLALPISTTVSSRIIQKNQFTHQFPQERFLFSPQKGSSQSVSSAQRGFHHRSNPSLPTIVETDASNYAFGAVLSQVSDSGTYPITFNRGNLIPAQLNYEINYKDLLRIVWALKRWRAVFLSLSSPFEVLTNHSSLKYFISSKFLTRRQARLAEFLAEFHFSISYCPGHLATLLNAISHWDNVYPERGWISSARIQ
ncbi:hypothetical protein O181_038558 [Austropuccinia psidii MF-1]|uniref:Reverse transcriptase RNase H-like domain-containing protein n=1 Tax=Austropuccinia psidii MF-1 TaxID=1389203 RepID=A0A9Q3DBN1_9BASI|nr:hypothetical protein [Austropuccinia psidii MF-1]